VVRSGENLSYIAARYGTTVRAIARANGLRNPNRIYAGQKLVIPVITPASQPVVVTPPQPASPSGDGTVYVVRPGDTLYAIALNFNVTPYAIARANDLRNLNWIYVGQRLIIPNT
jgi:LysM repeat protein